jgi:hypothetical protein
MVTSESTSSLALCKREVASLGVYGIVLCRCNIYRFID